MSFRDVLDMVQNEDQLPVTVEQGRLEIANGVETGEDGRIYAEKVNTPFLREGGSPDEYRAGVEKLKADGLIDMHDSGAFFRFTDKGAQRFN